VPLVDGILAASFLPDQHSIVAATVRQVLVIKDDLPETARELRDAIAREASSRHP
jgi:hypothetical protein